MRSSLKQITRHIARFHAHQIMVCGFIFLQCVHTVTGQPPAFVEADLPPNSLTPTLNQIQVIGTHNSYHIAPTAGLMKLIGATDKDLASSIDYTHLPLPEQLGDLGVRQVELDIYADPDGALFAKPIGRQALIESGVEPGPDPNANNVLMAPGMKIIHSAGFDFLSTVPTLQVALKQILEWSTANPTHVPILILIELKQSAPGPSAVTPVKFDRVQLDALDAEILEIFPSEKIISPDHVRGDYKTLRQAVLERGWPKLDQCRGKVLFAMDNEGTLPLEYLKGHDSLEGRVMFVSVADTNPAAAFLKINNPIADFDKIQRAVKQGFLVRTRADGDTKQSRSGDITQREKAFASGAQYISTDYPRPDPRFTDYQVRFPNGIVARSNPVSFTADAANFGDNYDWDGR